MYLINLVKKAKACPRISYFFRLLILLLGFAPFHSQGKSKILNESLATIQAKALKGDVYYQGALGLFYKNGEHGLPIDMEEAARWVRMAANKEGALGLATMAAIELEKGNTERGYFLYDEA